MIVYLRYKLDKVVDRTKYFNTYSASTGIYKMLNGAPLLVNVEGSYVKAIDIPELIVYRKHLSIVNRWIQELKQPLETGGIVIDFKWRY